MPVTSLVSHGITMPVTSLVPYDNTILVTVYRPRRNYSLECRRKKSQGPAGVLNANFYTRYYRAPPPPSVPLLQSDVQQ